MINETNQLARPDSSPRHNPALKCGVLGLVIGLIAGGVLGVGVSEFGGRTSFPIVLTTAQLNSAAMPLDPPEEPDPAPFLEPVRDEPAQQAPSGG